MMHSVFKEKWEANKAKETSESPHACTCTHWLNTKCACEAYCTCHWSWCGQREDCFTCFHSEAQEFNRKDMARFCYKWHTDVLNTDHCEDWLRKPERMDRALY